MGGPNAVNLGSGILICPGVMCVMIVKDVWSGDVNREGSRVPACFSWLNYA